MLRTIERIAIPAIVGLASSASAQEPEPDPGPLTDFLKVRRAPAR